MRYFVYFSSINGGPHLKDFSSIEEAVNFIRRMEAAEESFCYKLIEGNEITTTGAKTASHEW